MLASVVLIALYTALASACASGEPFPSIDRTSDDAEVPPWLDAERPDGNRPDAPTPRDSGTSCSPPCGAGETCSGGRCVPVGTDADGDGRVAERDCDDANPRVGAMAERPCSSACGPGVERCTDGLWAPCNAPTECDCTGGTRTVPCERCGMQLQRCERGRWVNDGPCESGACSPGMVETAGACGMCGTQRRTCQADCTWSAWECASSGECAAGERQTEQRPCGECGEGRQERARTCGGDCRWGPWSDWGACMTAAECRPGQTERDSRACPCMGATETRTRTCDPGSCRWGGWSGWSGCPSCPRCGDGECNGGETCASCGDCQAGHLTARANNGDPCPGVPNEQWRCVHIISFGTMGSQVCRDGRWVTFHLNPRDCGACVCSYSV
ncbi:MAG: hypothetical protein NZ898_11635, partial [Myxococcota bacterium]|nr:hypothetical protein [Myxococcota bacterium]